MSGSGAPDEDTLGGDDTDTTVVISSGDGGVVSRTTTTRPVTVPVETIPTKNPDDEGGDDIDEITLIGSGVVISSKNVEYFNMTEMVSAITYSSYQLWLNVRQLM